jgi:hypothetical protein
MSFSRHLSIILAFVFIAACRPAAPQSTLLPMRWELLNAQHDLHWRPASIPDEGTLTVTKGEITMENGLPMTGCKFTAWQEAGLPKTNYSINYEAMRLDGDDIFAMCTFPVGSHQAHATFVIGGWGGTLTGISSIDFKDASENSTRAEQRFGNGVWHRVRIEVRPDDLRAWVNDRPVVNVSIKGRKVSLRPGFIDHCLPFGFATWNSVGKVRAVIIETLN